MKILERYVLKENLLPFITSMIVITFIMLLDRILDLLNLIIEKNLDFVTVVKVFSLSLPFIMALSVPMSVLMASIMSFARLSTDSELVAFKSCGINVYRLMRPTFIAAFLLSIFMVYFNDQVLPTTNHILKNLMIKINYRRPVSNIEPGIFNEFKDITVFAKSIEADTLYGVVIYNQKENSSTITAKKGNIQLANGGNALKAILYDGEMHAQDKAYQERYEVRKFRKFVINMPDLGYKVNAFDEDFRSDREMTAAMMRTYVKEKKQLVKKAQGLYDNYQEKYNLIKNNIDDESEYNKRKYTSQSQLELGRITAFQSEIWQYEVEIYKKTAIAFACLIFVMIGVPIGMMTRTSGVGMSFSVSSIVFIVYYMALIGGEELGDHGVISAFWSMWGVNFILGIVGVVLILMSAKEVRIFSFTRFKDRKRKKNANLG